MKKVLTIAGSDCSGGAGIQADIKTIIMHKMYAMSAITSMTAQNTMGVFSVVESSPEFLSAQLDAIFTDIFPDSIKIGMVPNENIINVILEKIKKYNAKNIVVDPVMVSTSGFKLISDNAIDYIKDYLLPIAKIMLFYLRFASINLPTAHITFYFLMIFFIMLFKVLNSFLADRTEL